MLESRRLLAAVIWHNVLSSADVNADGDVQPLDALQIINELNRHRYTVPPDGQFVEDLEPGDRPPFFDVNCSGRATPLDALVVINALNRGVAVQGWQFDASSAAGDVTGDYTAAGCHAQLVEGASLRTELVNHVTLPSDGSGLRLEFETPQFDLTSSGTMQDAFEVTVTDPEGNAVIDPFVSGHTASMNWSESTDPAVAGSMTLTTDPASPEKHSLLINLAHLPGGSELVVTARLINNDGDDTSSVIISELKTVSQLSPPPAAPEGETGNSRRGAAPVDIDRLEDVSSSLRASYGRTSYTVDPHR